MPAIKMPFRLSSRDLCQCEAMPFQQHHEARVERPLDDLDLEDFFQNVQANLRVGDEVTVCAYRDNKWDELMEVGVCRIVFMQPKSQGGIPKVKAVWMGETVKVPDEIKAVPRPEREMKLFIKKEFAGGFIIEDEKGALIERFNTKAEAEAYIDNLNLPDAWRVVA